MMKFATKNKWLLCVLVIWTIIFCVPSFRLLLKAMAKGSPWIHLTLIPNSYWNERIHVDESELPVKAQAIQSDESIFGISNSINILRPLDDLIQQNPKEAWLIALRLRAAVRVFRDNRTGGEMSDASLYDHIEKGIPSREKTDDPVNFTPAQLKQTLQFCRMGENLEPQNAYFTWMRVYFLMSDWQDAKAYHALKEAAAKTYWNAHDTDFTIRYVASAQKILGRSLSPYELSYLNLRGDSSTNSRTREMGRILAWQGVKFKRQGDHAKALKLWSNWHRTMTLAAQGDSDTTQFLVNYAMLSMAEMGATYPSRESMKVARRKKLSQEQRINGLIAYANKYHRPDLAQQFKHDWQKNHTLLQKTRTYVLGNQKYFSHVLALMQSSAILFALSVVMILSIFGALLAWVLLEIWWIYSCRKSTFSVIPISIDWWQQCKGIIACSGLYPFSLAMAFLAIVISLITITVSQGLQYDLIGGWGLSDFTSLTSNPNRWKDLLYHFGNISGMGSFPVSWRMFSLLTPLICGAIYALFVTSENQPKTFWRALKRNVYLSTLFLAWGIFATTTEYNTLQIIVTVIAAIYLLISLFWMWRKSARTSGSNVLQLFRSILAGWICTASVLVFFLLIGQTILNNCARPWLTSYLFGEMHLLHDVQDSAP